MFSPIVILLSLLAAMSAHAAENSPFAQPIACLNALGVLKPGLENTYILRRTSTVQNGGGYYVVTPESAQYYAKDLMNLRLQFHSLRFQEPGKIYRLTDLKFENPSDPLMSYKAGEYLTGPMASGDLISQQVSSMRDQGRVIAELRSVIKDAIDSKYRNLFFTVSSVAQHRVRIDQVETEMAYIRNLSGQEATRAEESGSFAEAERVRKMAQSRLEQKAAAVRELQERISRIDLEFRMALGANGRFAFESAACSGVVDTSDLKFSGKPVSQLLEEARALLKLGNSQRISAANSPAQLNSVTTQGAN